MGTIFSRPDRTGNTWLDLIGVPVMQRFFGGNDRAQKQTIVSCASCS
ncbi:MAG: hypothetical protein GDA38_17595 [Hormoscilla sp. SP12CHS1]|nr:hypothetical protein [Hormoscilla sp. SP12CHS1]